MVMITVALKVLVEEEEEVYTEEEVEEIKPRRVRSQRKVSMKHFINVLSVFGKHVHHKTYEFGKCCHNLQYSYKLTCASAGEP